jgi:hypothetical protein
MTRTCPAAIEYDIIGALVVSLALMVYHVIGRQALIAALRGLLSWLVVSGSLNTSSNIAVLYILQQLSLAKAHNIGDNGSLLLVCGLCFI